MDPSRRAFVRLLLSTGAFAVVPACTDRSRYSDADAQSLEAQKRVERAQSGTGPDGPQNYRGYRQLAELPWFELDDRGVLRCTIEDLPPAVDVHAHLGMSLLLAPEIDLLARTDRVRYLLDCDAEDPGCELDLDVYMNAAFSRRALWQLRFGVLAQLLWGSAAAATHTIPNLLDEMDAARVGQTVILPIAFGLPYGDDLTERWSAAIAASDAGKRLLPGASVHPRDPERLEKLRRYAAGGARAVKLHPAAQRFYPDAPEAMEIYGVCAELGLPVIFHAGRAGIEPSASHPYTMMRNYEPMLARYPEVQFVFGHAGARDVADAVPLAQRYRNVWLGIHGQGVATLRDLIDRVGHRRLLFGTDWPFYPIAATLAKVLLVTVEQQAFRDAILRDNAEELWRAARRSAST